MKRLLLLLIMLACSVTTTNAQKAIEGRPEDSRILKQLSKEIVREPVYLIGNLITWVNDNNEFVVYAETPEKKYLFVLQMESARAVKGKFVTLTFIGDAIVLNDGKADFYFGIVPIADNKALEQAHMTERDFSGIVIGKGITRHAVLVNDKHYSLEKFKGAKSVYDHLDLKNKS
jgi:hypothetical protein